MTPGEQRECATRPTSSRRADYRASRLAAKRAVLGLLTREAAYSSMADAPTRLRQVHLEGRDGAPPTILHRDSAGRWAPFAGSVSVAHRDGRGAAAAVGFGMRTGVDLERIGSVSREHARYFAGPRELTRGPHDATSIWVLKEAAWKALELDGSLPLRCLALEFDRRRELLAVRVGNRRLCASAALLHPWIGYVAAVVLVEDA